MDNSSIQSGSTNNLHSIQDGAVRPEDEVDVKSETTVVFRLRMLVFFVLFATAVSISFTVYYITVKAREEEFLAQFEAAATLTTDAFVDVVESRLGAVASIGVAMTANGIDQGQLGWPFVTLSSFQQRARNALYESKAVFIGTAHFIADDDERNVWEDFARNHSGWM